MHLANANTNTANAAGANGVADRRPQHGTGLAGMGGMGSERIRPMSATGGRGGVDFDSILAKIRDGVGLGVVAGKRPALPAAFSVGSGLPPALPPVGAGIGGMRPGPGMKNDGTAPTGAPTAGHSIHLNTRNPGTAAAAAAGSVPPTPTSAENDAAAEAIAQLRTGLAETQAALAEAVRAAEAFGGLVPSAVVSDASADTATDGHTVNSFFDDVYLYFHFGCPCPFRRTHALPTPDKRALPACRNRRAASRGRRAAACEGEESPRADDYGTEARKGADAERARTVIDAYGEESRRAASVNVNGKGRAAAGTGSGKAKGKSKAKAKKRPKLGVDLLEDLEIDDSALRDAEGDEDDGDEDEDEDEDDDEEQGQEEEEEEEEGERGGAEHEEEWAVLDHVEAGLADMTLSRASFGRTVRGGLKGVFNVGAAGDDDEDEAFPTALSAMHLVVSPTAAEINVVREGGSADEAERGQEEAEEEREEGEAGAGAEDLAALSAQLDALSIQLGTLHGRLRALHAASPMSFADDQDAAVEGSRLDGLDTRVRALEVASASIATSASAVPSSLPTPDPSPSIPSLAPLTLSSTPPSLPLSESSSAGGAAIDNAQVVQADMESIQAGFAALQAEWAAFRTEIAAFPSSSHFSYICAFCSELYSGRRSAIAGGSGWLRRRQVYGADADVDGEDERASNSSSSLSDDQDVAAVAASPSHRLRASRRSEDDDDARVPGRWGLLTPEGSVRGDSNASAAMNIAVTPIAKAAPWLFTSTTPTGLRSPANGTLRYSEGAVGHREGGARAEPLGPPAKQTPKARHLRTDIEQTLLLVGAVGAGAMIVAAAWWGA
ncbi:hypothetical protein MSAN_00669100 [Mycena sanguinolenta]|uniref:Uncharacterized protein n=1 Tax=Mycena sanguinolenta TaxID=230812 RepID=A0A8H7DGC6_9AGAR|nr:hypothetical protein MSAN_00669100 [Mycena sanguinolenta]